MTQRESSKRRWATAGRPRSLSLKAVRSAARAVRQAAASSPPRFDIEPAERPLRRGDCLPGGWNAQRPCPFVGCRHHLFLDVLETGSIKLNFPRLDVDEIPHTCALDVADGEGEGRGGTVTLEDVGRAMNVTRERVRQVEHVALIKVRHAVRRLEGES